MAGRWVSTGVRGQGGRWVWAAVGWYATHHKNCPDGVVEEDDGGGHEHGEADELVELDKRDG